MASPVTNRFNNRLKLWIGFFSILILGRLLIAAYESNNWRGFLFTAAHLFLVATVSFYALRQPKDLSLKVNNT